MGELAEEVLNIVHAFSDKGRKDIIRNLALRVSGLESDLQAARLTIANIERETLEHIILAAIDHGLRCQVQGNPEGSVALGKLEVYLRSLLPPRNCPHGLDRRAKCALCTVEGL